MPPPGSFGLEMGIFQAALHREEKPNFTATKIAPQGDYEKMLFLMNSKVTHTAYRLLFMTAVSFKLRTAPSHEKRNAPNYQLQNAPNCLQRTILDSSITLHLSAYEGTLDYLNCRSLEDALKGGLDMPNSIFSRVTLKNAPRILINLRRFIAPKRSLQQAPTRPAGRRSSLHYRAQPLPCFVSDSLTKIF
jgi:hypothetical protein